MGVAELALGRRDDAIAYLRKSAQLDTMSVDNEQVWLAAVLEMNDRHDEAAKVLAEFIASHPGLHIDGEHLQLLRAPVYNDCREQVLKALASAGCTEVSAGLVMRNVAGVARCDAQACGHLPNIQPSELRSSLPPVKGLTLRANPNFLNHRQPFRIR